MGFHIKYVVIILLVAGIISCRQKNKTAHELPQGEQKSLRSDTANKVPQAGHKSLRNDTIIYQQAASKIADAGKEAYYKLVAPVKKNFMRINAIKLWIAIKKVALENSGEGGEATYYFAKDKLEKIVAQHYGETGKVVAEYYLLNGKLSFVFEQEYKYNRPIYWDAATAKEANDKEVFEMAKSEIAEDRSYFANGELIHQENNEDCGSPFSTEYLKEEEKRLWQAYNELLKLVK